MKQRQPRNWSDYNQRLKRIARVDFFLSSELLESWYYAGPRRRGGKQLYCDGAIELCLTLREFFRLALRQTQGFVQSLLDLMNLSLTAPDYTTLSRRCSHLKVVFRRLQNSSEPLVLAVDSTGLRVYNRHDWNRLKHKKNAGKWQDKWRKLHLCIDVESGEILSANYTRAAEHDCTQLKPLIDKVEGTIQAVSGDMAYDTVSCRKAIYEKKAKQLIPPKRCARLNGENRNLRKHGAVLHEREEAIRYIRYNTLNDDASSARKSWKEKVGYHVRSLVETTMSQVKAHASDQLSNRKEANREVQAMLKCKLINRIIAA